MSPGLRLEDLLASTGSLDLVRALRAGPWEGDLADPHDRALLRLLRHPEENWDLRGFQEVHQAVEALRQELLDGRDLPTAGLEGLSELLAEAAIPPEVPPSAVPPPDPAPLPDPAETAATLLALDVDGRSPA